MAYSTRREADGRYTISCSLRTYYAIDLFTRLPRPLQDRVLRLIESMAAETVGAHVITVKPKH